jgi:hypothetical protein
MPRQSADQVLVTIRERIDYQAVFAEFCGAITGSGEWRETRCLFHDDSNPSMGINLRHGGFRCHACHASGDFIDFYRRVRSVNFVEAVEELARRVSIDWEAHGEPQESASQEIDPLVISATHDRLIATSDKLDYLMSERGLTREIIDEYKIGHDGQRFYIPIMEGGAYVNIRRYDPSSRGSHKMISWRTGFGQARLWPMSVLFNAEAGDVVYIFEGEMDCLLARSRGLNAVTCTGGAGTWRDPWSVLLAGLNVVICYDSDAAGRAGAAMVARKLHGRAERIRVVGIPLPEIQGADFTDYIVGHGHELSDFHSLVRDTPDFEPSDIVEPTAVNREPVTVHLSQASLADYDQTTITMSVIVSGKTHAPYIVPSVVEATCSMPGVRMCERCPVASHAGRMHFDLELNTKPHCLELLAVSTPVQIKNLKTILNIPSRCSYVRFNHLSSINVEEVQLIPEVAESDEEAPYVTRAAYYQGHGLQANRGYVMTGITLAKPDTQMVTHLIRDAVPSRSNLDAFTLTDDVIERLKIFQPDSGGVEGLNAKLDEFYQDLENVTMIFNRRDIMTAVDLVYHSILQFDFQNERLKRGWCEALVIGDSRTGKSTIVERMRAVYRAGELSSGEHTSLAGLVGGLTQIGTTWTLQWGKVPLNDRRLLVVDEAGSLPPEQIAKLSSMRSSGVAEIVKIHTEKTNARTRMIWIANPRGDVSLSSFSQGVVAVKELIGAPEDVARFDLFCTAVTTDVPLAVINAQRESDTLQTFDSSVCHQRVMWAWSRSASDVDFTQAAVNKTLFYATIQGERYRHCAEIPLVEPNEQRIKIARIATAAAAMFFSTDESGSRVIVKPEHVEFAFNFLEKLFAKPSLAFAEWAEARHRENTLRNVTGVQEIVGRNPTSARQLMEQETLTQTSLREILRIDDRDDLRKTITTLTTAGFLARSGGRYRKTPAGIRWLRARIIGERGSQVEIEEPGGAEEPDTPF